MGATYSRGPTSHRRLRPTLEGGGVVLEHALQVAGTYPDLLEAARFAMDRGLVALALPDHYLLALDDEEAETKPAPDAFIQLGGLARETADLDLVMLVSPITFRHPAVLAKMAVTLNRMSGGRFTLGVGTGWMDREHEVFGFEYPPMSERFNRLEEALGYLTAAFDPGHPGFQGDHYRLEPFRLSPPPVGTIPLLVGGTGAFKTPRLAGMFANEFNIYPGPDMAERIQRFRDSAVEAGRDPDTIRISSSGQVVAAATESGFENLMNAEAAESKITREELDAHFEKRQTPRGTYDQVNEQLAELEQLGVSRFYFQGIFIPTDTGKLLDGLGVT
jgi:alkanesulfonate monooxygenase SsuD/methylene tetrahydromethanopterin reductase-like flavin-dependent oxidoreductase (luciferase family)